MPPLTPQPISAPTTIQTCDQPSNPISAVTHLNPYPFYADLVRSRPIYFDAELGCWVAASAEAVTAALTSDLCRVRPPSEPVPKALLGSPTADVFGELVRMNDGAAHRQRKTAVSSTLMSMDAAQISEAAHRGTQALSDTLRPDSHPQQLTTFSFQLPLYVVGSLLGIADTDLPLVALWMADFVAGLAPSSGTEQIARGKDAAVDLLNLFTRLRTAQMLGDSLLTTLGRSNLPINTVLANAVGFLSQSYEATAGLIGNTLVTLARQPDLLERVMLEPRLLRPVVQEVSRYDPSVQNTRRYLAEDAIVAGQHMCAGDTVLVVLAAANRDPQVNPDPDHFDFSRSGRCNFTFGLGVHACPGETLAVTIAQAGVEQILASGIDLSALLTHLHYRPSANTRIPLFEEQTA